MSEIKILARRSSCFERAIIFKVNGVTKEVSAPFTSATFDELESRIQREYGDDALAKRESDESKEPSKPAPEKPTTGKRAKKAEVKSNEKDAN